MTGIFKERNTFQVVFLFVIAVLAKLAYMLHPPVITYMPHEGLLTDWLNAWYAKGGSKGLSALLALVINLGSAIYANAVIMSQRMFQRMNMLVAVSMVLMSSLVPEANILSAPLLLLPFIIRVYQNLAGLYHSASPKAKLFNIGLGIGVGTLLYHPFICLLAIAIFGLASMRPFKIQEWLVLLLGLLAPYYFYLSYEFLTNQWHPLWHVPSFVLGYRHINHDVYSLLAFGMVIVWITIGFYHWQANLRRMLIQARKNWNILLFLAAIVSFVVFIKTGSETDAFALAVFPLSAFAACAFAYPKKVFFPNLLFWVIVFIVILTCLRHYEGKI